MLSAMTMRMQRYRLAGLAAAVLVSATAAGAMAQDEAEVPVAAQPPTRTIEVVSTEGPTAPPPAPPTPSGTATAPLPALPNAAPAPPSGDGSSSEPAAPSEYDQAADMDPAALDDFHDTLAPYGTWEDDQSYGTVWVPNNAVVGSDFAPYVSDGHWGLDADNSWLWVSDFSWGWAPFHYGRWVWIGGRGWGWIPGRVYSPAWVVWRTGYYDNYYVGWAPMPPTWHWRHGWAFRLGYVPPAPYVFCASTHVFAPHVRGYLAPPATVGLIGPRTRPYVAASPGVVSTGHTAISMTRGPSMIDAHVPGASIPAQRVSPDARAVSFAQSHPARPYVAPRAGTISGRGEIYTRPSGPSVYTTRPSYPSSAPGAQTYSPRPYAPSAGPVEPRLPTAPRPMPVTPSPRPYSPSGPSFSSSPSYSRPMPMPAVRPSAPAPVARPASPPAANFARPSAVTPHAAPAARPAPASRR